MFPQRLDEVDLKDAYEAAMERLGKMQQEVVLLTALSNGLKSRNVFLENMNQTLRTENLVLKEEAEDARDDEGGVVHQD